jgi:hypothetical protein
MNVFGLEVSPSLIFNIVLGFAAAVQFITILALFVLIPESFTLLYNKAKKGVVGIYDREDGVREIFTPNIDKETGLIDLEGKYVEITPRAIVPLKCGVRSIWISPKLNRGITGYDVDAPYRYNPASTDVKIEQKAEARAIEKKMADTTGMLNKLGPIVAILMCIGIGGYLIIQAAGNYSFCKGLVVSPQMPGTTMSYTPTTTLPAGPIEDISGRVPLAEATTTTTLLLLTTLPITTPPTTSSTTTTEPTTTTTTTIRRITPMWMGGIGV